MRGLRRLSPFGEGAVDEIDHRHDPTRFRRLGWLDLTCSVVGILHDMDATSGEVDVTPFQSEGFADTETGEEAEDGDRSVPPRGETWFLHRRENFGDLTIGVDGTGRDSRVIVARGALNSEIPEGISVDAVLGVEPAEHVAHGGDDVACGGSRVAVVDEAIEEIGEGGLFHLVAIGASDMPGGQTKFVLVMAEGIRREERTSFAASPACVEKLGCAGLEPEGVDGAQLMARRVSVRELGRVDRLPERSSKVLGLVRGEKISIDERSVAEIASDEKADFRNRRHVGELKLSEPCDAR